MAQPFDYTINVPNPVAGFLQGMQIGGALRQQREQQQKAAKVQELIQKVRTDPSPDNFAELYVTAPELAKPIQIWQQTLDAPRKNAVLGVLRNVKPLFDSGNSNLALQELDKSIEAFKNTPGYESQVASLQETKRLLELNPDAGKMRLNSVLYNLAPEEYENVWKATQGGDSTFIKELKAEGLQEGTPEFQDALRKKREGDPFVIVPGVGVFRKADLMGVPDETRVTANIPAAAIRDVKNNPALAGDFIKKYGKPAYDRILREQ